MGKLISSPKPSNLHLAHPTADECKQIWTNTFPSWGDSLEFADYLKESSYLTTVPLAKNGGQTNWILVDKNLEPDQRDILCSCESFKKRALISDAEGKVKEGIIHGIASVFCPPENRGRGYAACHMKELGVRLRDWQSDDAPVIGSVLYSDIGKTFYAKLGWVPTPTNTHIEFTPKKISCNSSRAHEVQEHDLSELCERDEEMIRATMTTPSSEARKRIVIIPDIDHMLWHIRKEEFATQYLFGKTLRAKGAIAGAPGRQVWAVWTHRYYGRPDAPSPNNVLYILRLVVEGDLSTNKPVTSESSYSDRSLPKDQMSSLQDVLQAARNEAAEWQLDCVKLWEPSPWVRKAIADSMVDHVVVEREHNSIASAMWYGDGDSTHEPPVWINNEHYAWV
ncbi:hypothetical protein F4859DRAFT_74161 [Xylaria cf. heliscus]|nr:hypothetical protein F4859DRAFT_74161 [Xylaria cf. heliscus]